MLRSGLLWLSGRDGIQEFVRRNGVARSASRRFVAGETANDAVAAVRTINARGLTATLDLLGESVTSPTDAAAARDQIVQLLDTIRANAIDSHVSLKLTQLGLDIEERVCQAHMEAILERADGCGTFVRIDMEDASCTNRTLRLFRDHLHPRFGDRVGVVLQSCLRRSEADLESLLALGACVRLVKGAYAEPAGIAYVKKHEVDAAFGRMTERLLAAGRYPAIATHDERLIEHARDCAYRKGITPGAFEFQFLYGVRRDLHEELRREGYRVRLYIPFGTQWYPYLLRRLAERPANVAFVIGNVLRETFRRS